MTGLGNFLVNCVLPEDDLVPGGLSGKRRRVEFGSWAGEWFGVSKGRAESFCGALQAFSPGDFLQLK